MSFVVGESAYRYLVGSDVERDGMYVEVFLHSDDTNALIEIFYSDQTHEMTISLFERDLPTEVVEWAIAVAKERLPSIRKTDHSI